MPLETIASPVAWVGFVAFVLVMLALDLGVFHRKAHAVTVREALGWSAVWVALALVFGAGIWVLAGPERGLEYLTGYVIEKALSVDNLFVFVTVFGALAVPRALQHRVLFWGVLGALVMRAGMIAAGAALIARFHWIFYVFGGFLVLTGLKMVVTRDGAAHPEQSRLFRSIARVVPTTSQFHGQHFFVREGARTVATPLFLALVLVEITDVVFAVDSIPAIFAVTRDPFIVFTSNVFAILGLRSLYFLLADVVDRFVHLRYGLAAVLVFVGGKMLVADWVKVPVVVSLGVVALLIGGSIVVSLVADRPGRRAGALPPAREGD